MGDPRVGILESDFRPQISGLCNLQHIWQTLQLACSRAALDAARLSRRDIYVLVVEELDAFEILGTVSRHFHAALQHIFIASRLVPIVIYRCSYDRTGSSFCHCCSLSSSSSFRAASRHWHSWVGACKIVA